MVGSVVKSLEPDQVFFVLKLDTVVEILQSDS